ncbi:hypothetical protein BASA84_000003 [Batrachochytrium salamandrivorans]|nr:hypothetical protein BASA84_000003 [Batrachochytrium salamandrivorans]
MINSCRGSRSRIPSADLSASPRDINSVVNPVTMINPSIVSTVGSWPADVFKAPSDGNSFVVAAAVELDDATGVTTVEDTVGISISISAALDI